MTDSSLDGSWNGCNPFPSFVQVGRLLLFTSFIRHGSWIIWHAFFDHLTCVGHGKLWIRTSVIVGDVDIDIDAGLLPLVPTDRLLGQRQTRRDGAVMYDRAAYDGGDANSEVTGRWVSDSFSVQVDVMLTTRAHDPPGSFNVIRSVFPLHD